MDNENGKLFSIVVYDQQGKKTEEKSHLIFIDKKGIFSQSNSLIPTLVFNYMANGDLSTMEDWLIKHGFAAFNITDPIPEVLRQYVISNTKCIICNKYQGGIGREVYDSVDTTDYINAVLGLNGNQRQ